MQLHAETPVRPAEWQDVPLVAFLSSVSGLLILEQLAVCRKTFIYFLKRKKEEEEITRVRKAVKGLPLMCTETEAKRGFLQKTLLNPCGVHLFNYSWSRWIPADLISQLSCSCSTPSPPDPIGWRAARYPVEKDIPSTVRAAVFVLPNSIPFHSLSAHCLFWCFFTLRGLTD